jgi:hypothetical protein
MHVSNATERFNPCRKATLPWALIAACMYSPQRAMGVYTVTAALREGLALEFNFTSVPSKKSQSGAPMGMC